MEFIHYSLDLGARDIIQVELETKAFVRLMDDDNYSAYRTGTNYRYYGGLAERSPANIKPPFDGRWHLCVDLGGKDGKLNASVHIIQEVAPDTKQKRKVK